MPQSVIADVEWQDAMSQLRAVGADMPGRWIDRLHQVRPPMAALRGTRMA